MYTILSELSGGVFVAASFDDGTQHVSVGLAGR